MTSVKLPPHPNRIYPTDSLRVGQRHVVSCEPTDRRKISQRLWASIQWVQKKAPSRRFAVRMLKDGVGLYRLEDRA